VACNYRFWFACFARSNHHLEDSLNPREIGGHRVRWYEFVGNRLHLKTREDAPTHLI